MKYYACMVAKLTSKIGKLLTEIYLSRTTENAHKDHTEWHNPKLVLLDQVAR